MAEKILAAIFALIAALPAPAAKWRPVPTAYEVEYLSYEEPAQPVYLGLYWVTGYDLCVQCCGIWSAEHPSRIGTGYVQTTASGVPNKVGVTIAAGPEFAFGARLYIEGVGERIVQDRGVGNGCIDVLCKDHAGCADVTGWREVWLLP
jgi:3D (Asp-Asp-Asp) domain-containing protein